MTASKLKQILEENGWKMEDGIVIWFSEKGEARVEIDGESVMVFTPSCVLSFGLNAITKVIPTYYDGRHCLRIDTRNESTYAYLF